MTALIEMERDVRGVVTLWLNRPEVRNALNAVLIQGLTKQLATLAADESVRILVLRGRGSHFCAGADLQWMREAADYSFEENFKDASQLAALLSSLDNFPAPIISYVHGGAFGGALGLMACCDIVLAEHNAVFSFSEVKLGLVPAMIARFVVRRIGMHNVRRYFLTAEQFDGTLARDIGLVHELVPLPQAQKWIEYFTTHFLAAGPDALKATKALLHQLEGTSESEKQALSANCIATVRAGEEAQLGMAAFFDKAQPPWVKGEDDV